MLHLYQMNDLNIVLDVNSGSVHVFDDVSYELLERLEEGMSYEEAKITLLLEHSEEELDEIYEEIKALKDQEQLYATDAYQVVVNDFSQRETVVKALCLHIAHDCNLKCKYCFAGEGEYHGDRSLMSLEVGKKSLDFLIANSGSRRNLEVDFFGGEPLMNFEVVKDIVAYGRSLEDKYKKHFRFTLTTNGVLLNDEIIDFLNQEMHNVVLSVDGRKEVHDKMRPTMNGKGSYDLIMPKFKSLVEKRDKNLSYYVRGTYTHFNRDFSQDVLHLADQGFKEISVEPVVAEPEMDYALTEEDIPILMDQYDLLAEAYLKRKKEGKGFNFFHFTIDLDQGPCVYKRLTGCGAGHEYMAVTPWGDLYPCHQFVGQDDFKMGDVDQGIVNTDLQSEFKGCNVYNKEACEGCWAKFYCSGGCMANAYNFTGDIHKVYDVACELEKKRVETAIYLKAKQASEKQQTDEGGTSL